VGRGSRRVDAASEGIQHREQVRVRLSLGSGGVGAVAE